MHISRGHATLPSSARFCASIHNIFHCRSMRFLLHVYDTKKKLLLSSYGFFLTAQKEYYSHATAMKFRGKKKSLKNYSFTCTITIYFNLCTHVHWVEIIFCIENFVSIKSIFSLISKFSSQFCVFSAKSHLRYSKISFLSKCF